MPINNNILNTMALSKYFYSFLDGNTIKESPDCFCRCRCSWCCCFILFLLLQCWTTGGGDVIPLAEDSFAKSSCMPLPFNCRYYIFNWHTMYLFLVCQHLMPFHLSLWLVFAVASGGPFFGKCPDTNLTIENLAH